MSLHKPNSPSWWASFFEYDRGVQLEFVHEAIAVEFDLAPTWADDFWGDAIEAWEEKRHVHVYDGELSTPQVAMMLAGNELFVKHEIPLVIEQVDVVESRWRIPLGLSRYNLASWTAQTEAAAALLRDRFPWICGWRIRCIKDRAETSIEFGARRTDLQKN